MMNDLVYKLFEIDIRTLVVLTENSVIPIVIAAFTLVESPRWLLNRGKIEEGRAALNKISHWNTGKGIL